MIRVKNLIQKFYKKFKLSIIWVSWNLLAITLIKIGDNIRSFYGADFATALTSSLLCLIVPFFVFLLFKD